MKKLSPRFLFFLLLGMQVAWLDGRANYATALAPDSSRSLFADRGLWKEDESKRSIYSRTFITPDGRIIAQSSKAPLCYKDKSGNLQVIDCTLKPSEKGWEAVQQTNPCWLNFDGSTTMTLGEGQLMTYNQSARLNGYDLDPEGQVWLNKNEASFGLFHTLPIAKKFAFNYDRIETDYVIYNLIPTIANTDLHFSEEIILPDGFTLSRDLARGKEVDGCWQGDLLVYAPDGSVRARFFMPVYYDMAGAQLAGAYQLVRDAATGVYTLKVMVPGSWLNDPARVFPVTIDPLVTGPTTTWAGGTMPSCLLPAYNADSILVVIPGQISITGLWVQSSYEASVFTNTPKSDGRMYFSTNCGTTPVLTVTGSQGALPGTAYLQFTNYRNPLACCLPQTCAQQTIWLRMHLARSAQGAGCNTNYIYYDPFTTWPFSAYVEGRTVETYAQQWTINTTTICSNQCTITATVYARYGVPPYTITHPWASGPVVMGAPLPCSLGNSNAQIQLTIPGCPTYCQPGGAISIPSPTITDACGNTVTGFPPKTITILTAPDVTAIPNPLAICSGEPVAISFTSCEGNATFSWTGDNATNGSGNISTILTNTGTAPNTVTYTVTPSANGCTGQPVSVPVQVNPFPGASAGNDTLIYSATSITLNGGGGNGSASYSWAPPYNLSCTDCQYPTANPSTTTTYTLYVTENGCTSTDTVTVYVEVSPWAIVVPNTFTPNGNGVNDLFRPEMLGIIELEMHIFNRWGELLYSWNTINGSWDGTYKGEKVQQGVYVWLLHAVPEDKHHPPIEMTGTVTVLPKTK
ncbi:MAG: gliding motility-associated C-terminal domain-containing protein [Bacteroidota bacterium]